MESTPRSASSLARDFEQRLENLRTTGIHDDRTLNNLESFLNQCSNQLTQIISSSDSTLICIVLPSLLRTIIGLTKICSEKSDLIHPGAHLSQEKFNALITNTKNLYNQIREFLKSNKLNTALLGSIHLRHFCEQIHQISDSIAHIDIFLTFISHKLIIKLLTGGDDPQQSQQRIDDRNDDLLLPIYESVLRQIHFIGVKSSRDGKEAPYLRVRILIRKDFFVNRCFSFVDKDVWNLFSNDSTINSMQFEYHSTRKYQ